MTYPGFIIGFLLLLILPATSAYSQDIRGLWRTPLGETINIAQCGASLCAKVQSFTPPNGQRQEDVLDENNHDATKRSRKILGLNVLWNITPVGENTWQAEGYDPRRGYEASVDMQLLPSGALNIKGCKRVVINVCDDINWQRQ